MQKSVRYIRSKLSDNIESYIAQNQLKPNDRLPSERTLSELWNVSRMTLRSAVNKLIDEGVLIRKAGSGTFIAPKKVTLNLGELNSFKHLVRKQNLQFEIEVHKIRTLESDKELSKLMDINLGTELIEITRKRIVEEVSFSIEKSYLLKSLVPEIINCDFTNNSLFEVLEKRYQLKLYNQRHLIQSIRIPENLSYYLDLDKSDVCLYLSSNALGADGEVIVHTKEWVRPDRCVITSISTDKN